MVTLNIYQILNDKHRGFMKKILKNPKTIITLALIFIVYFLPFVFIYLDKDNKPYSYCPTGFYYQEKSYLLFCGLNKNAFSGTYNFLAPISVYFFPVILFFLHAILLFVVRKKSKVFQDY